MRSTQTLPDNYSPIFEVDLQNNKKMALWVNLAGVVLMVIMAVPAALTVPISALFDMSDGVLAYFLRFSVLIVAYVAYIILHELTHGIAMKLCGTKKVKYGFTGLYAFAGSDDYYGKGAYIFIALAPVVLWGVVLAVICPFLPPSWFWVAYFVQIGNIGGAAGDFYVTFKFCHMPSDILVKDRGVGMVVYSAQK